MVSLMNKKWRVRSGDTWVTRGETGKREAQGVLDMYQQELQVYNTTVSNTSDWIWHS
jgi:hypothetical protein